MTQTAQPSPVVSRAARIAFWALVAVTGALTALHLAGILFIADGDDERLMFTCYAALNALSLVVLLGPFREGKPGHGQPAGFSSCQTPWCCRSSAGRALASSTSPSPW